MIRLWINQALERAGRGRLFTLSEHLETLEYLNACLRQRVKDLEATLNQEAPDA